MGSRTATITEANAGVATGFDYQMSPHSLIGIAVGGGHSSFEVSDRATTGRFDAIHAAVYGAWHGEHIYATGVASYDHFDNNESRVAVIPGVTLPASQFIGGPYSLPGFGNVLGGAFSSASASGHFEAGYRGSLGAVHVTPFVGLQFASLTTGAFTETDVGAPSAIALAFAQRNTLSLPTFLGTQFDATTALGDEAALTPG